MHSIEKYGVLTFIVILTLFLVNGSMAKPGSAGGNWTNATIVYPTNNTNSSTPWVEFNYTLTGATNLASCKGEVGNYTGYQNITGKVFSTVCEINATYNRDTWIGHNYNITLYAYNTTGHLIWSNITLFRVDTENPTVTYNLEVKNNTHTLSNSITDNLYQNWLNITVKVTDNSTSPYPCGIVVEHEWVNSTGFNSKRVLYTNLTSTTYVNSKRDPITSSTRWFDYHIPADALTDEFNGRIWIYPQCDDAMSNRGSGKSRMAVINKIVGDTWTPLASLVGKHNGPHPNSIPFDSVGASYYHWDYNNTVYNYLWNLTYHGNISHIATFANHTFITHQWNKSTNNATFLNMTNYGTFYVYADNTYTLVRLNWSSVDSIPGPSTSGNLSLTHGDLGSNTSTAWNMVPNFRANITKYVLNTSKSCGNLTQIIAWFNSSNDEYAGGAWDVLWDNDFGVGWSNETVIPFGTSYFVRNNIWGWYGYSNVNMTIATPARVGTCIIGGDYEWGD